MLTALRKTECFVENPVADSASKNSSCFDFLLSDFLAVATSFCRCAMDLADERMEGASGRLAKKTS
jgi:hypothetical protein